MSAPINTGEPPIDGTVHLTANNLSGDPSYSGYDGTSTIIWFQNTPVPAIGPNIVTYDSDGTWTDNDGNPIPSFTDFPVTLIA